MSDSSSSDDDQPLALRREKLAGKSEGKAEPASATKEATEDTNKADSKGPAAKPEAGKQTAGNAGKTHSRKQRTKSGNEGNTSTDAEANKDSQAAATKREKKVFDMPGQTRDTPSVLEPLRKYYESLRKQRPKSLLAKKWLCMHGLLSLEEAEEYLKEIGRNSVKSPVKKEDSKLHEKGDSQKTPTKRLNAKNAGKPKADKGKTKPTKRKADDSGAEDSDEDEDDYEETVSKKRPAAMKATPAKSRSTAKQATPKRGRPATKRHMRDVAFYDGGLDSDSDDDKTLAVR